MRRTSTHVPLSRYLFFVLEAACDFTTTGAVAPSSAALARALTARARALPPAGLRILEIGAGTGPATALLLPLVAHGAALDVIEPNPRFVAHLQAMATKIAPHTAHGSGRVTIHQTSLEDFHSAQTYDVIVSGLPLKNFTPDRVRALMTKTLALLSPHGSFTAFSYLGAERIRALTAKREALLAHLKVEEIVHDLRQTHGDGSVRVWANLPPAEAWSLRAPAKQPAPAPR
jgi:phospholipid N-methyltransferase